MRWIQLVGTGLAVAAQVGRAEAQAPNADDSAFGGHFFRRITARSDSAQAYAMVLPQDYAPTRKYPLLLVLDPRGRALVPLAKFGPPAARTGWLVMSSYNTASDGAVEPNIAAVNAMLDDAWRALSVDRTRVYLAGFSGTARLAWPLAAELRGVVRGIIELCAGPAIPAEGWTARFRGDSAFLVFSATGRYDFNHDEVIELDRRLTGDRIVHRTIVFDGGHEWGPDWVAAEAVEWIALKDRTGNLEGTDSAVRAYRSHRLADLDSLLAAGDTVELIRRVDALGQDLPDDSVVAAFRASQSGILARRAEVAREERHRIEIDRAWTSKADRLLGTLTTSKPVLTADAIALAVGLDRLQAERGADRDREVRASARRRLEWLYVNAAFYGPRSYAERRGWTAVMTLLEVARRIHPLSSDACLAARRALDAVGHDSTHTYPECT